MCASARRAAPVEKVAPGAPQIVLHWVCTNAQHGTERDRVSESTTQFRRYLATGNAAAQNLPANSGRQSQPRANLGTAHRSDPASNAGAAPTIALTCTAQASAAPGATSFIVQPAAAAGWLYGFDTSVGSAAPPDTLGTYLMTPFGPDPSPTVARPWRGNP